MIVISACLLLVACGSSPTIKQNSQITGSNNDLLFQQAQKFWDAWEQDNNVSNLRLANEKFHQVYTSNPKDLNYQHALYLSRLYLGFYTEEVSEQDLLPLYSQLAPSVKAVVPPPARLLYAVSKFKREKPEKLITIVQRAIQQNPHDAVSWKQLSEQYLVLGQNDLAAAAAFKAVTIDSSAGEFNWQLGYSLLKIAKDKPCDNIEELKHAAFYTSKAAAVQKDNSNWYADSALRYIDLGLLPLAHHQLQKSHAIEPSANYITAFVHSSILEGRDFQTDAFIEDARQIKHTQASFKALAMTSAAGGDWKSASDFMGLAKKQEQLNLDDLMVYYWLEQLAGGKTLAGTQLRLKSNLENNEKTIRDYIFSENGDIEALTSKLKPNNVCTKLQGDFYTAMKYWQLGHTRTTKSKLEQVAKNTNNFSQERIWALALLQGMKAE